MPLSGSTLLEWQLERLAQAGVDEAVVVTGFRADLVDKLLASRSFAGMTVRTLYNPFYWVADNLASCWMARAEMTGPFVILNGDTLFETAAGERVLRTPPEYPITVTINKKPAYDGDDMKVITSGDRLLSIGKTLDGPAIDGESIGFLRFTEEGAAIFVAELNRAMAVPEGLKQWYLSAIDRIAKAQGCVGTLSIQGFDWAELDFPDDYRAMQAMVQGWLDRDALQPQALSA